MVIRRVGPVSCARIAGILYAMFGLIMGAFVSLASLAGAFGPDASDQSPLATIMGAGAVIFFPIFYGVMGFAATFVGAWLYNMLAASVGGVELDVQ